MRAIVRFSVDGEKNSSLRNKLAGELKIFGFRRSPRSTATYEGNLSAKQLGSALAAVFSAVERRSAQNPRVQLDHIWLYADR